MNSAAAVVCVALTVLSAGTVTVTAYSPPSAPCCMPDQWEGIEKIALTQYKASNYYAPSVIFTTSNTSYDAINETESNTVKIVYSNGNTRNIKILSYYKNYFTIYLDLDSGQCQAEFLMDPFPKRCLPANAVLEEPHITLGSGNHTLDASRLKFQTRDGLTTSNFDLVATEDCMPVIESVFTYKHNEFTTRVHQFQDIQAGISSEDVFDIPMECASIKARRDVDVPMAKLWKEIKSR